MKKFVLFSCYHYYYHYFIDEIENDECGECSTHEELLQTFSCEALREEATFKN
jgi:hypothetical protein